MKLTVDGGPGPAARSLFLLRTTTTKNDLVSLELRNEAGLKGKLDSVASSS